MEVVKELVLIFMFELFIFLSAMEDYENLLMAPALLGRGR